MFNQGIRNPAFESHGPNGPEKPSAKSMVPLDTPKAEEFIKQVYDKLFNEFSPHEIAMILQTLRDGGLNYLRDKRSELQLDIEHRTQKLKELDDLVQPILANKQ